MLLIVKFRFVNTKKANVVTSPVVAANGVAMLSGLICTFLATIAIITIRVERIKLATTAVRTEIKVNEMTCDKWN